MRLLWDNFLRTTRHTERLQGVLLMLKRTSAWLERASRDHRKTSWCLHEEFYRWALTLIFTLRCLLDAFFSLKLFLPFKNLPLGHTWNKKLFLNPATPDFYILLKLILQTRYFLL